MVRAPTKYIFSESPRAHLFKTSIRSKIPSLHLKNGRVKDIDDFVKVPVRLPVRKIQRVLTSGKENTKDFDIGGQPVGLGPDGKVYVDVFVATYLEM